MSLASPFTSSAPVTSSIFARSIPTFKCVYKRPEDKPAYDYQGMDCPMVSDSLRECSLGYPLGRDELLGMTAEAIKELPYSDKKGCVELCQMFDDGSLFDEALKCNEDQCSNYDDFFDGTSYDEVKRFYYAETYPWFWKVCKRLGFKDAVDMEVLQADMIRASEEELKRYKETMAAQAKDAEAKEAEPIDTEEMNKDEMETEELAPEESDTEAFNTETMDTEEKKDSGAGSVKVYGWKVKSVVATLAFGSIFLF
ncbi:hypothetical protein BJ508DRAFT_420011 [Ascobolus immersus RN42]|uniref:Uncharacterized protein n=1 Tax=Ascobolus immersus RN42 TaxID=1160509 RepID=A0A3N4HND5_ASCIM|nr:hypothetical protein BJ508DRAFT_420011 [Ascobolus immersus RN42]